MWISYRFDKISIEFAGRKINGCFHKFSKIHQGNLLKILGIFKALCYNEINNVFFVSVVFIFQHEKRSRYPNYKETVLLLQGFLSVWRAVFMESGFVATILTRQR